MASAGLRGPSGHGHALLPSGRAGAPLRPPRSRVSVPLAGEALLGAKAVSGASRTVLPPQA